MQVLLKRQYPYNPPNVFTRGNFITLRNRRNHEFQSEKVSEEYRRGYGLRNSGSKYEVQVTLLARNLFLVLDNQ